MFADCTSTVVWQQRDASFVVLFDQVASPIEQCVLFVAGKTVCAHVAVDAWLGAIEAFE